MKMGIWLVRHPLTAILIIAAIVAALRWAFPPTVTRAKFVSERTEFCTADGVCTSLKLTDQELADRERLRVKLEGLDQ